MCAYYAFYRYDSEEDRAFIELDTLARNNILQIHPVWDPKMQWSCDNKSRWNLWFHLLFCAIGPVYCFLPRKMWSRKPAIISTIAPIRIPLLFLSVVNAQITIRIAPRITRRAPKYLLKLFIVILFYLFFSLECKLSGFYPNNEIILEIMFYVISEKWLTCSWFGSGGR